MLFKIYVKKAAAYSYQVIAFALDFLGFKYIWCKFHPNKVVKGEEPRTITLWLLSIIAALFSIASSRYEQELYRLEYRVSNLVMQTESSVDTLSFIPTLQHRKIPYKPSILNPLSTIKSFFTVYDEHDVDLLAELQDLLIKNKNKLFDINLNHVHLANRDLSDAIFRNSSLNASYFVNSILMNTDFNNADLLMSNFSNAYLQEANLSGAYLGLSIFNKANLRNANLRGATLYGGDFREASFLGADLSATDIAESFARLKDALYNSKDIKLGNVLKTKELFIICGSKSSRDSGICPREISEYIVKPTKFPSDFNPKDYGMIDVSEE